MWLFVNQRRIEIVLLTYFTVRPPMESIYYLHEMNKNK